VPGSESHEHYQSDHDSTHIPKGHVVSSSVSDRVVAEFPSYLSVDASIRRERLEELRRPD
jgi:hypothetical protein